MTYVRHQPRNNNNNNNNNNRSKWENQGGIGDIKGKDDLGNEMKVTDVKGKAEVFARYFSAVFTRESNDPFRQIPAANIGIPMSDVCVTQEQIESKLKS